MSCTTAALSSPQDNTGPWQWSGVERVVAVGDIHGAYSEFTQLLKATDLVDDDLRWRGGDAHLVSLGDLLDRGPDSRKVMDLLIRLQEEAQQQGGRVHVVVGNHETMNLTGDLRYVSTAEFASFENIESKEMRDLAYQDFALHRDRIDPSSTAGRRLNSTKSASQHRAFFDDRFPPGFFGHRSAFSATGYYGKWLLTLPTMVVVNNTVYVHGGLPPSISNETLEQLNQRYFSEIQRYLFLRESLTDAGVLLRNSSHSTRSLAKQALQIADPSTCSKRERSQCKKMRNKAPNQQKDLSTESISQIRELIELDNTSLFSVEGPLWYRGSVRCSDLLERPTLQAAMDSLQAKRLVVGHTPTSDKLVHVIRDNKVVLLDTGMLFSHYKGRPAALFVKDDALEVQYLNPKELEPPKFYRPDAPYPMSDATLITALKKGAITDYDEGWFGRATSISIDYKGTKLSAIFYPDSMLEVAAFELDRTLGFGLVPITVSRVIGGDTGSLQLTYPESLSESARKKRNIDIGGRCSIEPQYQLQEIYDLLIGNTARNNKSRAYVLPSWSLYLTENLNGFTVDPSIQGKHSKLLKSLPSVVLESLSTLDQAVLEQALGAWLSEQQLAAILARRDALLNQLGK